MTRPNASLYMNSDNLEIAVKAMILLREQFLIMPLEEFVNVEKLQSRLPQDNEFKQYLLSLSNYLNFKEDSYRYYMTYLEDELSSKVAEAESSHYYHTDMYGRIRNRNASNSLRYAMGFSYIKDDINVKDSGNYECNQGYVEEVITTNLGNIKISGCKNINNRFHGYCEIIQEDGTQQSCFFNDGKILARRIHYANGMNEDGFDREGLAVDIFKPRKVYEMFIRECEEDDIVLSTKQGDIIVKEVLIDKEKVKEIYTTLGKYKLELEYRHYVEYPYDQGDWEEEKASRVPGMNMALLYDGELFGALVKTNGYSLLPIDAKNTSFRGWYENYVVLLDNEVDFKEDNMKLALKQINNQGEK